MGTGKVTVEHLGLKDCPRCNGEGNIESQEQQMPFQQEDPMNPQETPQEDPMNTQDPMNPQEQQVGIPQAQPPQEGQTPEEPKKPNPFTEEPKKPNPFTEAKKKAFEQIISCACNKSVSQFEGYINRKLKVLSRRCKGNESVGLMFGLPTIEREGKKIKGILAYAGVSLNNRIYLPEELAKGDGLTLPLMLNHSAVDGAEEEMDRLDDDMRDHLNNGQDFVVGEVTLRWEPDELTLYYEGVIEHPFFQKEVDDADMAVSLGIYYDSDSPTVCNQECYTLIKGAEFREVSLVYHPGFPIATIEAVEAKLKRKASEAIAGEQIWIHSTLDGQKHDIIDKKIKIINGQYKGKTGTVTFIDAIAGSGKIRAEVDGKEIELSQNDYTANEGNLIMPHSFSVNGVESVGFSSDNGSTSSWTLSTSGGNSLFMSATGREAQLQPYYSLPKALEEQMNVQPNPEVKMPQDTMKEKIQAKEDFEICPECGYHASDLKQHYITDHGYSPQDASRNTKKKLKKSS